MNIIVLDSSVLVKWVNSDKEQNLEKADKILDDVRKGKVSLIAPELAKYEVGNTLINKGINLGQAAISLGTIYASPVQFIDETEELAIKTFEFALQGMTYYDAAFVALAKEQKATLVTANPKHQGKVKGVKVIALKDY